MQILGKTTIPLRLRIKNHKKTVKIKSNFKISVSAHAAEHKISTLEDCYFLKGFYHQEEHPHPEFNNTKLGNVEIARQIN